jgi:hypothetical protein
VAADRQIATSSGTCFVIGPFFLLRHRVQLLRSSKMNARTGK